MQNSVVVTTSHNYDVVFVQCKVDQEIDLILQHEVYKGNRKENNHLTQSLNQSLSYLST